MTFQGNIQNDIVVCDEVVALPEGSIVRVESVKSPKEQSIHPLVADAEQPRTVQQMAQAWKNIAREIAVDCVALPVDPDDDPLF